jgi:hypothetical protein
MSTVTNSIARVYNSASENIPHISSPSQILRKVKIVALPAIALIALGNLPGADAGPWASCLTIAACLPLVEIPPLFAACLAAAGVALALPTP